MVASSAGTLRRCVKHIAEGGRSERDLRDEGGGPFDFQSGNPTLQIEPVHEVHLLTPQRNQDLWTSHVNVAAVDDYPGSNWATDELAGPPTRRRRAPSVPLLPRQMSRPLHPRTGPSGATAFCQTLQGQDLLEGTLNLSENHRMPVPIRGTYFHAGCPESSPAQITFQPRNNTDIDHIITQNSATNF